MLIQSRKAEDNNIKLYASYPGIDDFIINTDQ